MLFSIGLDHSQVIDLKPTMLERAAAQSWESRASLHCMDNNHQQAVTLPHPANPERSKQSWSAFSMTATLKEKIQPPGAMTL